MKDKTVAAIVAAVNMYLLEEQQRTEAAYAAPSGTVPPLPVANSWGMAGRDDAMKLRSLWQLGVWRK
ncbi:MAG: hypothetical protein HY673_12500 [Chloroflexi bacterium]|nr:hypothetical protein [Chloroflexota bacterium]